LLIGFLIFFWYWIFSKLLLFVAGISKDTGLSGMSKIFVFFVAIFMVVLMEFLYSLLLPPHDVVIPLKGLWDLAFNLSIWANSGIVEVIP